MITNSKVTFYRDTPAIIAPKIICFDGKKMRCIHCKDNGDIPTAIAGFDDVGAFSVTDVVNPRGNSYAIRNRDCFRNKKRYNRKN